MLLDRPEICSAYKIALLTDKLEGIKALPFCIHQLARRTVGSKLEQQRVIEVLIILYVSFMYVSFLVLS